MPTKIKKGDLDYKKVVSSIRRKVPALASLLDDPEQMEDLLVALRRHAFFVTTLEKISTVKYVQRSLQRAVENGSGFKSWKEQVRTAKPAIRADLKKLSDARLETIYRTNMAQAQEDGTVEAAKKTEAFIRFSAVNDSRTRPSHAQLDGITLPAKDPFWETHRCPLDFNCRCTLIAVPKSRGKKTNSKTVEKQEKGFREKGGSPAAFAKNTTQDAKSIRKYTNKRAKSAGIGADEVKQLEKRNEPAFARFASKVLSIISGG